jgi:hypothetical protein
VDEQQRVVSMTEIVSPPTAATGRKPSWIRVKAPTSQG